MTDSQLPVPPSETSAQKGTTLIKAKRPWFKKKRFVILTPVLFFLVIGWIGSLGEPETELAGSATSAATAPATEKPQSAEDIAAAEAEAVAQAEEDTAVAAEKAAEEAAEAEAAAAEVAAAAEAAAAAAAEAAAEAAEEAAEEAARGTISQQNALRSGQNYLDYTAFSRTGLIKQLEFEGFPTGDATWGVDRVSVDWNVQAAKSAKTYLEYSSFSRSGLVDQLLFEGFSAEQAEYGVNQTGL